jgi:DNA-binding NtrC family response regulator
LRVLLLGIPPLRERASDIASLAENFIVELNERYGLGPKRLSDELRAVLESHDWPGNVRELRAVIESMYVLSENDLLSCVDLPPDLAVNRAPPAAPMKTIAELERDAIQRELVAQTGNRSRVARALGISRSTLYRKLVEYGIE